MKQLTIMLCACALNIFSSHAQQLYSKNGLTITASGELSTDGSPRFGGVRSVSKDGYLADYEVDDEWEVYKFDRNFKQLELDRIVVEYDKGAETDYNHVLEFNGRIFLLKGAVDREKRTNLFTKVELDMDGAPLGEPEELASVAGDAFYANPRNSHLSHMISADGSKLLVLLKLPEQRIGDGRLFTIYKYFVYDLDMNLLWSKVMEFRHEGGRVIHESYNETKCFQNDGTVAAWGVLDRGRKVEDGIKRFAIRFYTIGANGVQQTDVDVDDKLDSWRFRYANDRVYLFDTFGVEHGGEGFRAVVYNSRDNKGQLHYIPFGKEHLVKNQPEKEAKRIETLAAKGKPIFIPDFHFYDIIPTTNGGFILTGQEGVNKVHSVSQFTSYTEYIRSDFHLIGIDADCEKIWSQIIPLNQKTQGGDYGCLVKPVGDRVYCLFHDLAENLVATISPEDIKTYKSKKDPLGMIIIDTTAPDAQLKRTKVLDFARLGGWLVSGNFRTEPELNVGAMRLKTGKDTAKVLWFDFEE